MCHKSIFQKIIEQIPKFVMAVCHDTQKQIYLAIRIFENNYWMTIWKKTIIGFGAG